MSAPGATRSLMASPTVAALCNGVISFSAPVAAVGMNGRMNLNLVMGFSFWIPCLASCLRGRTGKRHGQDAHSWRE